MESPKIPSDAIISHPLISPTTETAIPVEIFDEVLSYLQPQELMTTRAVSRTWHQQSIDVGKKAEDALARFFIETAVEKLDDKKYSEQKAKLLSLASDRTVLGSVNLMDIVTSMHTLRDKIINILKEIDFEDLITMDSLLENERKPVLFNFVCKYAMLEKGIDYANSLDLNDRYAIFMAWVEIISGVLELQGFDLIDVIINRIPEEVKDRVVAEAFVPKLVEHNQVEKAAELTSHLTDEESRNYGLSIVSKAYFKENKIEAAVGCIEQMTYNYQQLKEKGIREVVGRYCENGEIVKASEFINNLPEGEERETDLIILDMTKALIEEDKSLAEELAKTIPNENFKNQALYLIKNGSWFFPLPTKQ